MKTLQKHLSAAFHSGKKYWSIAVLVVGGLLTTSTAYTQADTLAPKTDTVKKELTKAEAFKKIGENILAENRKDFADKQLRALQKEKVILLREESKKIETYFQRGIDTTHIEQELNKLESLYQVSTEGITIHRTTFLSSRNLISSELLLIEISKRLETVLKTIETYKKTVDKRRKELDSLSTDSALYYLPADTSKLNDFIRAFKAVTVELVPSDKKLTDASASLDILENRAIKLNSNISLSVFMIDGYRKDVTRSFISREMPGLFGGKNNKSIQVIFSNSVNKAYNIILFFIGNNTGSLLMISFLILLLYLVLAPIRKKIMTRPNLAELHIHNEIVEQPFLSSVFIVLTFSQLFFVFPPFALQAIFWMILTVTLYILHKRNPGIFTGNIWLYLLVLFLFSIADNLLLEATQTERILITIMSMLSAGIALRILKVRKEEISKRKIAKPVLYLFLAQELISFVSILAGRYNLSKTFFTGGYVAVIAALFLYWTYQLLIKALNTYTLTAEKDENNMFFRLQSMHDKTPGWISAAFMMAWVIIFLRNFYLYTIIVATIAEITTAPRTIGKLNFTLESIFIFILVLFLSGVVSKLISFLAGDQSNHVAGGKKKGGLSNWLLLIRLSIIIIGVLIAFASAGIPMDRLTIIIGSLSLGIGFGLQTIVNNLISGVILAFERPIEIGDQIEVAGKIGHVKEIGIRSSKLIDFDGAEVIIPNGDLLSQHVINWTLSNSKRRVELIIGVKYGSDLEKVKEVLENIIKNNPKIEHDPAPAVLLHKFNSSSIDLRLLFWSEITVWVDLKSEIILSIDKSFKEAGIEIPFPQQDIYIKEIPANMLTKNDGTGIKK